MSAVHYYICTAFFCSRRLLCHKFQVGSMGLIDNKNFAVFMYNFRYTADITAYPIIIRTWQNHCLRIRILRQTPFNFLRHNLPRYSIFFNHRRIRIYRLNSSQHQRIKNRLVTVSRHNQLPAFFHRSQNCSNKTAARTVYQWIRCFHTIQFSVLFCRFSDDAFHLKQIVSPRDFRYIAIHDFSQEIIIPVSSVNFTALMSRHMKRNRGFPGMFY